MTFKKKIFLKSVFGVIQSLFVSSVYVDPIDPLILPISLYTPLSSLCPYVHLAKVFPTRQLLFVKR